jgi:hypothetical protein
MIRAPESRLDRRLDRDVGLSAAGQMREEGRTALLVGAHDLGSCRSSKPVSYQ